MDNPLQILNLRVRGIGRHRSAGAAAPAGRGRRTPPGRSWRQREAYDFAQRAVVPFAVYDRAKLASGGPVRGPGAGRRGTSTTVVPSGQRVEVDEHGYLVVTLEGSEK